MLRYNTPRERVTRTGAHSHLYLVKRPRISLLALIHFLVVPVRSRGNLGGTLVLLGF